MPTFMTRMYKGMGNALSDAYGYIVHGDEAGNAATMAFVIRGRGGSNSSGASVRARRPTSIMETSKCKFDLGASFLEVNGRAYVKAVDPQSEAARAGIEPRDCLQLALVLAHDDDANCAVTLNGKSTVKKQLRDDDEKACAYAVQCEREGSRTSFEEFRDMFENCIAPFSSKSRHATADSTFESSSASGNTKSRKTASTLLKGLRSTTQMMASCSANPSISNKSHLTAPASPLGEALHPVVLVFRRTRKRELLGADSSNLGFPSFRLDDECDRAASFIRRLVPPNAQTWTRLDAWDQSQDACRYLTKKHTESTSDLSSNTAESTDTEPLGAGDGRSETPLYKEISCGGPKAPLAPTTNGTTRAHNQVEVQTIRTMIQHAVGLAFVRTSKLVLGLSVHFGSGIVISRMQDGTWSAPSAIGIYGGGVGLQFGLEMADYIFILQTNDALEHFRRGGNYTIGGRVGREACGAASLDADICSPLQCTKPNNSRSPQPVSNLAPVVVYALSQGLYFGVSLEGSKIFTRDDINLRTYKFTTSQEITANDILSGNVSPPPAAQDLYKALHSVEFTDEGWALPIPIPPSILRNDLRHNWHSNGYVSNPERDDYKISTPLSHILSKLSHTDEKELTDFEIKFKNYLRAGVSVLCIRHVSRTGQVSHIKRKKTISLQISDTGAIRLGFTSVVNDHKDLSLEFSESDNNEVKDIIVEDDLTPTDPKTGSVVLLKPSEKYFLALTDVTSLSLEDDLASDLRCDDRMNNLGTISIKDVTGASLIFVANNKEETELLICGLKLLLERETARLGVRGGLTTFNHHEEKNNEVQPCQGLDILVPGKDDGYTSRSKDEHVNIDKSNESIAKYDHGQKILKDIASNIILPFPFPFCRALLLESNSPLMILWEKDRGDTNLTKTAWSFSSRHNCTKRGSYEHENELIASGTMEGGQRNTSFNCIRNGQVLSSSETYFVDTDNDKTLNVLITERLPRKGFSIKVRIVLHASTKQTCAAFVTAELCAMGKNMSNQDAVHKALLLLVDELKGKYGKHNKGLISEFLGLKKNFNKSKQNPLQSLTQNSQLSAAETSQTKTSGKIVPKIKIKIDSLLKTQKSDNDFNVKKAGPAKASITTLSSKLMNREKRSNRKKDSTQINSPERPIKKDLPDRPSTPSFRSNKWDAKKPSQSFKPSPFQGNFFDDMPYDGFDDGEKGSPATVEVKPLPKIRLCLLPAPREEDEEERSAARSKIKRKRRSTKKKKR